MQKKVFALTFIALLALGTVAAVFLLKPTQAVSPLCAEIECGGTVDKKPNESFTVKITFKNKGTIRGTWEIAVTFEGDHWTWRGEKKELTLKAGEKKTLVWEGKVPENAQVDSIARLVVYYDNEFVALNWWIHVISGAELHIIDSKIS
jgi:uncharacterized cupredoxin-like copper-binding protein